MSIQGNLHPNALQEDRRSTLQASQSTSNLSMKPFGPKVSLNTLASPASRVVKITH